MELACRGGGLGGVESEFRVPSSIKDRVSERERERERERAKSLGTTAQVNKLPSGSNPAMV